MSLARRRIVPYAPALAVVALAAAANAFYPHGRGPDDPGPPSHILGAALWFLYWSVAVLGWGLAWRKLILPATPAPFAAALLGTLWASLCALLLGILGLIGPGHSALLQIWMLTGPLLAGLPERLLRVHEESRANSTDALISRVVLLAAAALIAVFLVAACAPQGHPDPLYYHLLGPRVWTQEGRIRFPPGLLFIHLCTTWEELAIWCQSLLGGGSGQGLIEGQVFMQWTHALFGVGGCLLALRRLLGRFSDSRAWRDTAALTGISAASLTWTAWLAKNDWGASFWVLGGIALLYEEDRLAFAAAGFALGMGFAAKFTTAFTTLPFLALALTAPERRTAKRDRRRHVLLAGGLALGAAPTLLVNLVTTGNPFFPALDRIFKSGLLNPALQTLFSRFEGTGIQISAEAYLLRLALLVKQTPIMLAFAILPVSWLAARPRRDSPVSRLRGLWLATFGAVALFQVCVGSGASLRLAGPSMVLLCALSVLAVEELAERIRARRLQAWLALACAALAIYFARPPWESVARLFSMPSAPALIRAGTSFTDYPWEGSLAAAWLRANANHGESILVPDDSRIYYLAPLNVLCAAENTALQAAFADAATPAQTRDALRSLGVRYVLTTPSWIWGWKSRLRSNVGALGAAQPEAIVFSEQGAAVLDVSRLK